MQKKEEGGARDEPEVSSGSWGVSNSRDKDSHASVTIRANPAEVTCCSNGSGVT